VWIGSKRTGGKWKWYGRVDGSPFLPATYQSGKPLFKPSSTTSKTVCVKVQGLPDFSWAEGDCGAARKYMCERPSLQDNLVIWG